jgi:hypothetical protein
VMRWPCRKSRFMQFDIRYSELNDSITLIRFVELPNSVF